jgi:hypothetical protein
MGRERFFFNLGALGAAFILIVVSAALGPGAVHGVGLGMGIGCCVLSIWFVGALAHERRFAGYPELRLFGRRLGVWSTLGGAMASVAIWEIVEAAVFRPDVSRWLTLANGLVIAVLSAAGLVVHEVATERVVHVLEVVQRPEHET